MSLRQDIAGRVVNICFPPDLAAEMMPLLISEQPELEAVFGAPVVFVDEATAPGPRWTVERDPDRVANTLRWDADSITLRSLVQDAAGLGATLQMLHSLVTLEADELSDDTVDDLPQATDCILREIERGFPGFGVRGLTFADVRANYPSADQMSIEHLQALVADLGDGHTAVRAAVPVYNPPYAVAIAGHRATILRVPPWSAAAASGVQSGWTLQLDDLDGWLARSGSAPHAKSLIAGRRAIALNGVTEREFVAQAPRGETRTWTERARPFALDELISHDVVAGNALCIHLHNWIDGVGIESRFDQLIADYAHVSKMILDLRGNTGGNLLMAKRMRRRFLRQRTMIGTIQFTRGDGTLADPVELWDEPAAVGCWPGDLIVLTDPLTYSASEDFLHGLQGLPHVTVIGTPSGGGSGRPRTLPLIPGWTVSISTALTFDRNGHCIEAQGIPVDIELDPFSDDWRRHLG